MQPRKTILTILTGGSLIGVLLGLEIDPVMKSLPEPAWHDIRPDPMVTQPHRIVDHGPQDLSPTWYMDRMPTWKRRAAMREAAMYEASLREAATYDPFDPAFSEPLPEPSPQWAEERPVVTVIRGTSSPLDEAAEQARAAPRHAVIAVPDAGPAVIAIEVEADDSERAPRISLTNLDGA